ncbi:lipopolysaccharide biosynthesis protein [Tengunoibacter tsumagoiensis]|uniref:Uncharacterized protein n=1 Tax=Tengunoibacter tsumagoiensis TaxID=2014871 RepID=A0A401ZWU4_9CHLR|nr:polysaccharide biosynthesis C-terminal domain-containing protein [Tengunoibacter tsumagoiensis]GCE11250.1 hypothetical protein KTT_11090 [Tengunoibacter tsumagoiensis]
MYIRQSWQGLKKLSFSRLNLPGFWSKGLNGCALLVNLATFLFLAHVLGSVSFAMYLFLQWLAGVSIPILGLGMSALNSRAVAEMQSRESPPMIAGIFYFLWSRQHRHILLYSLIYLIGAFPLSWLWQAFSSEQILLASLGTLPLLLSNVAGTTLRSLRRADLLALLQLFGALVTLLLMIFASQINGQPLEGFLLAFALAQTLTLMLAVFCVIRLLPLKQALQPGLFLKERLMLTLKQKWSPFMLDAIIWQRGELLLLASFCPPVEVGLYALSAQCCTLLITWIPALFVHWLQPLLFRYEVYRYRSHYDAFVKISCMIIFMSVFLCVLLSLFCPALIAYCLGADYLPMVKMLRILLLASVFGSLGTVSLTYLAQRQPLPLLHQATLVIAIGKVVLTLPLILLWGATGAAFASMLAQCISALFATILCHQVLRQSEQTKGVLR